MAEIGILDGADADRLGHAAALLHRQPLVAGGEGCRPLHPLVEERLEPHRVAGPGLERLAVIAEHGTEGDMDEVDAVDAPAFRRLEQLIEVLPLTVVDHVEDPVGLPVLESPADRRQIGRGIEEGTVGLADEERWLVIAVEKDPDRAAALAGQPLRLQIVDDSGQERLKEAFPEGVVEADIKTLIEPLDVAETRWHEPLPEGPVVGIPLVEPSRLEKDLATGVGVFCSQFGDRRVGGDLVWLPVGELPDGAIDPPQFAGRIGGKSGLVSESLPAPENHPELRAPVAEVVVGDRVVAAEAEDPGDRVADHRRANMADMHRLGDVRRAEIDDDRVGLGHGWHPEAFVAKRSRNGGGEGLIPDPDIDESGANGITRGSKGLGIAGRCSEAAGDFDGKIAWFLPRLLRQSHRHRAGIVAEFGVSRFPHLLEQRGDLRGVDRHDPIGGEALEGRDKAAPQPVTERPGRRGCGSTWSVVHHHGAAPADGRGTRRASLQRCSRSQ